MGRCFARPLGMVSRLQQHLLYLVVSVVSELRQVELQLVQRKLRCHATLVRGTHARDVPPGGSDKDEGDHDLLQGSKDWAQKLFLKVLLWPLSMM